ncbi:MAG TPA: hypothetical protein VGF26_16615 [Ramlibacter sp.]
MQGAALDAAERADAARYALLRRLAPAMRHHLVVNLQPIAMVNEVMDRKLRAPQPDLAQVQAGAHKIHGFARAALHSCLDVVNWLAPDEPAAIGVEDGVRECAALLATSLAFAGCTLRTDVQPCDGQVHRSSVRHVLTAALLQLTDMRPAPAELVVSAVARAQGLQVTLSASASPGQGAEAILPAYRPLTWDDVQALADAEGVALAREPHGLRLTFPWILPQRA